MNLLVLGPQGAGKGTQAKRISRDYAIPHIATGDIFRDAIAAGSELGRRVEPIVSSGGLVPDEITIALIRERLGEGDTARGFVLDGFPRTEPQATALDELLAGLGRPLDAILFFDLPDEVATERMLGRGAREQRADDTPEVIERRLATYHAETEPIVEHYRLSGKLVPLHAERTIPEVYAEIKAALAVVEDGRPA